MSKNKKLTEEQKINLKRKKIINYHKKNPHLYEAFVEFTSQAFDAGYNYFSAEMIINRMRWQTMIVAKDDSFKIKNDVKPFYSRMLMAKDNKYKNFFKLRPSIWDGFNFDEL
jgi:hypothetical protein